MCGWPMSRLEIVLHIQDGAVLVVTCLDDLHDFNQPHIPGTTCCQAAQLLLLSKRIAVIHWT